ncbi:MAG TPA: glycoside hydrolase family 15 protein, partial [Ktedonobacterales bacterium]
MASPDTLHQSIGHHAQHLQGEPRLFVLDAGALLQDHTPADAALRKLALLAESEQAQIVVRGDHALFAVLEARLAALRLRLRLYDAPPDEPPERLLERLGVPAREAIFFLAAPTPAPSDSHAFYMGTGTAPAGAMVSRLPGPRGTDALLALYGTALIQEKAGLAFRAASEGEAGASAATFDAGLFHGLVKSYGRAAGAARVAPAPAAPDLDGPALRALAEQCFYRVLRNVQPNGAIVASPAKGEQPGQPNYWFVWQRDAGHTLRSLIGWARTAPFGLPTSQMQQAINSYLGFLARCQASGNLGVSRYTVDGQPITGYGSPQLDGPPISVLAMASLLDPRPVYGQMRAALEYLLTPEGQGPCFDPWEFVYGRILNVLLLKRKAFRAGARLAGLLSEPDDLRRYQDEVQRLEAEIAPYVDAERGYLVSNR